MGSAIYRADRPHTYTGGGIGKPVLYATLNDRKSPMPSPFDRWQTDPMTPNYRTVLWLESQGCIAGIVERKRGPVTQDLFGFADLVAVGWEPWPTLFIQATTGANHAARKKKMLQNEPTRDVLEAGNGVALVSWRKSPVRRGSRRRLWTPRFESIGLDDLEVCR